MASLASQLSNQYDYAIVVWGQSNARPWGIRDYEGFVAEPGMALASPGQDIKVTSIAGSVAVVADTLETNAFAGGYIYLSRTRYGTDEYCFRKGYGLITSNTTGAVTTSGGTLTGTVPTAASVSASSTTLTLVGHGLQTGDWVKPTTSGISGLTSGTWYVVKWLSADTFSVSTTWGGTAIAVGGSSNCEFAWGATLVRQSLYREARQIKVLTPYQPETPGAYPTYLPLVSQGNWPATVTSFEDAALWLPLTWNEGFDGVGVYATATESAGTWTLQGGAVLPGFAASGDYIGASVQLIGSNDRVYYGTVATNTSSTTVTVTWVGTTPPVSAGSLRVFWPHYRDNPNALRQGFRYPNVDMQPGSAVSWPGGHPSTTGALYDRHKGIVKSAYTPSDDLTAGSKPWFGMVYPLAWRLSAQLGRPIHVIHLGINSTSLYPQARTVMESFPGQYGWFDPSKNHWSPSADDNLAARLKDLITVAAPAATTSQAMRPLRILGVVGMQGEADALNTSGRDLYGTSLESFVTWLRRTIVDAGLSPYSTRASIPFVHAKISEVFRTEGLPGIDTDTEDVVNTAIQAIADADPFFDTFSTDDSSKRTALDLHFDGEGEATNAELAAASLLSLIELGLSATTMDKGAVDICNVALAHIGDAAKVTSLEPPDGSAQASYCARFYPVARDQMLEMMSWGFASRRAVLTSVENDSEAWQYAYAMPTDALTIEAVQSATSSDDFTYSLPTENVYGQEVQRFQSAQPFVVERNANGLRVIRTNQPPSAVARYTARVVDTSQYPQLFSLALSWSLAAMLAGPLVKGADGAAMAARCTQMMGLYLQQARSRDGQQRKVPVPHSVSWIQGR